MLFNKDDGRTSDRILYQTKPNMILGCKKAILGVLVLVLILSFSPVAVKFMGQLQVYLISYIKLPLTSYVAIAFFVIILINVIYIIWQLVGWYSVEYTLTESKIIIKSGILSTKKNYMPYATIQDINTSQNILEKVFNVGSVSVFSAYDNNLMELSNISNPSEVEEIIFSKMVNSRTFQAPPQKFPSYEPRDMMPPYEDEYMGRNDYYDEYEPITPITHESNYPPRHEYEYYPEDFHLQDHGRHKYEYEPYVGYGNRMNSPSKDNYYNRGRDEYSYHDESYYPNNEADIYYEEVIEEIPEDNVQDISEKAIRRHFDKFKK